LLLCIILLHFSLFQFVDIFTDNFIFSLENECENYGYSLNKNDMSYVEDSYSVRDCFFDYYGFSEHENITKKINCIDSNGLEIQINDNGFTDIASVGYVWFCFIILFDIFSFYYLGKCLEIMKGE